MERDSATGTMPFVCCYTQSISWQSTLLLLNKASRATGAWFTGHCTSIMSFVPHGILVKRFITLVLLTRKQRPGDVPAEEFRPPTQRFMGAVEAMAPWFQMVGEIVTITVQTCTAHRFLLSHPIGWKERRRPHMGNLQPGEIIWESSAHIQYSCWVSWLELCPPQIYTQKS